MCQCLECDVVVCGVDQFQCTNTTHCISRDWVGDGDTDCEDNADEQNCGKSRLVNLLLFDTRTYRASIATETIATLSAFPH